MFAFHGVTNDTPQDYVVRISNNPALRVASRQIKVYAREERVVDWSSVESHRVGLELRYGPRQNWHLNNVVEWEREGRPRCPSYHDKIVYRVGPPLPPWVPGDWKKSRNQQTSRQHRINNKRRIKREIMAISKE